MLSALLSLLGHERLLADALNEAERQRLGTISAGWLLSLVLIALPAGYAVWLVEHSLPLAIATGGATFALTLNLLRVANAGGGLQAGSSRERARDYRPGLAPAVFVGLLGLIFAQPAQLPLEATRLDPLIAAHRAQLVEEHRRRVNPAPEVRGFDAYAAELASCDFVVRRLALLWEAPISAARFTALYCLVILLPAFFAQFVAIDALRQYQLLRYRRASKFLAGEKAELSERARRALEEFPTYRQQLAGRAEDVRPLLAPGTQATGQLSLRRKAR